MVLHPTFGAHGSLSTDHPFIDDDWPTSRNPHSIARQDNLAGQEFGPLSGPARQQLPVGVARDLSMAS